MTTGMANAMGVGLQHAAPGIFTTLRVRRSAQIDRDLEVRGDAAFQKDVLIEQALGVVGDAGVDGALEVGGASTFSSTFRHNGTHLSFFGATPGGKPTVTGSTGTNAALQSLLAHLEALGLITDATSAGSGPYVPTVSGSRADPELALASLLSGLAAAGIINDDTTA